MRSVKRSRNLFFYCYAGLRDLHSFPTRRSSDLTVLNQEFEYCHSCGTWVGEHCEACKRRLNPGWSHCPYCGHESGSGKDGQGLERAAHAAERRSRPRPATVEAEDEPMRKAS